LGITVSPDRVILTGVSYIEASFQASWTDVSVFAEVTFPDVLSVDIVTPTDRPFKSLSRPVIDGFNANTDNLVQLFQKTLADIVTVTEGPEFTYTYGARESETQELADAFKYAKNKVVSPETLYLIDNMDGDIEFAMVKVIGELQLLQEAIANNLSKNLADSAEPTDVFTKLLTILRFFSDSLTSSDILEAIDFDKNLTETPTPVDFIRFAHTKPFADSSPALSDSAWHFYLSALGSAYDYTLPFPEPAYFAQNYVGGVVGETLSTSDIFISERIYGRFPVDAVNLGDGGVVSMQDYTTTTYFAADYVGVGRIL
jgi:hypothetical protein